MVKRKRIGYRAFYQCLKTSEYGYTDEEIRGLFQTVRGMDEESRGWVIDWIRGEGLPKKAVEDVSAAFLVEEAGMQPVNALIALDWLKHEPEMAKYYILKNPQKRPEEADVKEKMEQIAREIGIRQETPPGEAELEELTIEGL